MRYDIFPNSLKGEGFREWEDLILFFPRRYEDHSNVSLVEDLNFGEDGQVQVVIRKTQVVQRKRKMLNIFAYDESGEILIRLYHFRYQIQNVFREGVKLRVFGTPRSEFGNIEFVHPKIHVGWLDETSPCFKYLVPFYKIKSKYLYQETFRRYVGKALKSFVPREWLKEEMLRELGLPRLEKSIKEIHFPKITKDPKELILELEQRNNLFWDRIKFDELAGQQFVLRTMKKSITNLKVDSLDDEKELSETLLKKLPFKLTEDQKKVWCEIKSDLTAGKPSHRLIQGDVGCGKTVIAGLAAAFTVGSKKQANIMAPSEILASQLFNQLSEWFQSSGIEVFYLSGGLSIKKKKNLLLELHGKKPIVVVGTHALIQKEVKFGNLGLSIIDEQHRFGLEQRAKLRENCPHILGMSATPIPRSLAMTFLADMEISTIKSLPKSRKKVITKLVSSRRKLEILKRIKVFVHNGGQAFWVCPMINELEDQSRALNTLEKTYEWLKKNLDLNISIVHGKLGKDEQREAMLSFREKRTSILLATTVIEVGVNIPEAGLIIVENSERFGLAQLHQLRGRVGRGNMDAICIFLYEEGLTETAKKRLKILYESNDGFEIAKKDLEIRGPGEILGTRQSGDIQLEFSNLVKDYELVMRVVAFVNKVINNSSCVAEDGDAIFDDTSITSLINRWRNGRFLVDGT